MVILLSPSKTLDFNSVHIKNHTIPAFTQESAILIELLKQLTVKEIEQLMKISPALARLNYQRYHEWIFPFPEGKGKQAILAFKGDVYEGLKADTFTASDLEFSMKHLRILSGLYGVLRPLDLIMPYRLEMGIKLPNEQGKNLYAFWNNKITYELNKLIKENNCSVVINLASAEYYKSVNSRELLAPVITPQFYRKEGDKMKIVGFLAKRARGLMTNFIVKNRITKPADLKLFNVEGYQFMGEYSTSNEWVFLR